MKKRNLSKQPDCLNEAQMTLRQRKINAVNGHGHIPFVSLFSGGVSFSALNSTQIVWVAICGFC